MKVTVHDVEGEVLRDNETYVVTDNRHLHNLVVSTTCLHVGKETKGHKHDGLDEVYVFVEGKGKMLLRRPPKPHIMDDPHGPFCACGAPSTRQSGWCGACDLSGVEEFEVQADDVVLVPGGHFHKVFNTGDEDLKFLAIFQRYERDE